MRSTKHREPGNDSRRDQPNRVGESGQLDCVERGSSIFQQERYASGSAKERALAGLDVQLGAEIRSSQVDRSHLGDSGLSQYRVVRGGIPHLRRWKIVVSRKEDLSQRE
jgi:hypothetical protein